MPFRPAVLGLFLLFLSASATLQARQMQAQTLPRQAAIASANAYATDAGLEVLSRGGNAFDAAVAVSATLGLVEPASRMPPASATATAAGLVVVLDIRSLSREGAGDPHRCAGIVAAPC